jgi:hypothetical protein
VARLGQPSSAAFDRRTLRRDSVALADRLTGGRLGLSAPARAQRLCQIGCRANAVTCTRQQRGLCQGGSYATSRRTAQPRVGGRGMDNDGERSSWRGRWIVRPGAARSAPYSLCRTSQTPTWALKRSIGREPDEGADRQSGWANDGTGGRYLSVSPRVVMETLGHSQISLTPNTYSHVIPALGRAAAEQMDGIVGARSGVSATG